MKLIALGDNVIDYYQNTGEAYPGGNAVNVAVHAARLGAQAEYLGAFGDDKHATRIQEALAQNRVAFDHCPIVPGGTTKLCRYQVVRGERSFCDVVTGENWAGTLRIGATEMEVLSGAEVIISSCNAKIPEQLEKVQDLPAIFVFDFGEKKKYRTDSYYNLVCHGIDLAMLSCAPMEEQDFTALCAPLHRRGVVHVLATMGAAGQMLSVKGKVLKKATRLVDAYDTMGAGDSFLAAFVCALYKSGWRKGCPVTDEALLFALEQGQRVAAQNCMVRGGFGCTAETAKQNIITK